jgi:hypothetical protein
MIDMAVGSPTGILGSIIRKVWTLLSQSGSLYAASLEMGGAMTKGVSKMLLAWNRDALDVSL